MKKRIGIIGAGNLGQAMAAHFALEGPCIRPPLRPPSTTHACLIQTYAVPAIPHLFASRDNIFWSLLSAVALQQKTGRKTGPWGAVVPAYQALFIVDHIKKEVYLQQSKIWLRKQKLETNYYDRSMVNVTK